MAVAAGMDLVGSPQEKVVTVSVAVAAAKWGTNSAESRLGQGEFVAAGFQRDLVESLPGFAERLDVVAEFVVDD